MRIGKGKEEGEKKRKRKGERKRREKGQHREIKGEKKLIGH